MSGAVTNTLLREWHGPLTRDLVLEPAAFGLGQRAGAIAAGRDGDDCLRLLFDGLRAERSS